MDKKRRRRKFELGPPRAAVGFPWIKEHRTLAEVWDMRPLRVAVKGREKKEGDDSLVVALKNCHASPPK